jgi:hypothetical protein
MTSCASRQSAPNTTTVGVTSLSDYANTNEYHMAYIDVKDTAHNYEVGKEPSGDESTLREWLWKQLEGLQIESTSDNNSNADLHVICRFKHTLMMPAVTPGFQIKTTDIGKCTIKIVDKKTDKVLFEKSWVRGKNNGELQDFIGSVFAEWKKQRLVMTPPVTAPPQ